MDAKPFNRTPCDAAIKRASQLAREIVSGQIGPIDGAHEIAWLATGDCYDFLNESEVVGAMAGFWQLVNDWEIRQDDASARTEISGEIRQAALALIDQFS